MDAEPVDHGIDPHVLRAVIDRWGSEVRVVRRDGVTFVEFREPGGQWVARLGVTADA